MADSKERTYVGLRDLTDARALAKKRQEAEQLRNDLKREWSLNRAFYNGQQWSIVRPICASSCSMPVSSGSTAC